MIAYFSRGPKAAVIVAAVHLCTACATRKPPPAPPVYPPTSESSVKQLAYLPSVHYYSLETVTIEAEPGNQYAAALKEAREGAASKGANAMVLMQDKEFPQKVNHHLKTIRRTVFQVVRF